VSFHPQQRGVRLFKANCYDIATNGFARAFVEAAWVAIGCSAYFGDFYKRKRALGKKPNIAILATARLMARITWQLLTQRRAYTSVVGTQYLRSQPAERITPVAVGSAKAQKPLKDASDLPRRRLSPAIPK
jgi:hypothetical protein